MNDCLFCKIITKEIPATIVYEDEHTLAFLDNNPNSAGHTLVIPKDHSQNIYGISEESLARTILTVKKVAVALKNGLEPDGINLAMNNEPAAGQVIFHAHIHVIPCFTKDGFERKHITYAEDEKESVAEKIRENV